VPDWRVPHNWSKVCEKYRATVWAELPNAEDYPRDATTPTQPSTCPPFGAAL